MARSELRTTVVSPRRRRLAREEARRPATAPVASTTLGSFFARFVSVMAISTILARMRDSLLGNDAHPLTLRCELRELVDGEALAARLLDLLAGVLGEVDGGDLEALGGG